MTLNVDGNDGSTTIRGPTLEDVNFTLSSEERNVIITPSVTPYENTIDDSIFDVSVPAVVDYEHNVLIQEPIVGILQNLTFESVNPTVGTVNQLGVVTRVSNGTVKINAKTRMLIRQISLVVSRGGEDEISIFSRFTPGSLARECADAVDDRIDGLTASVAKPIYSVLDDTTPSYTRNTGCWAADIDLTCMSPQNSHAAYGQLNGTLVSPRHIITASHYTIGVGHTLRFIRPDNSIVTKTVVNAGNVAGSDITVSVLDSDVPSDVTFAKILPSNWANYLPGLSYGIPALGSDSQEKALITEWYSAGSYASFKYPVNTTRLAFSEPLIAGDSGSPAFLIINGEPVLLTTWHFGGPGAGPFITYFKTQTNSLMTSLGGGGGYQLTEIDISSFTDFS